MNGNSDDMFKFNIQKSIRAKARKPEVQNKVLSADLAMKPYDTIVQFIDPGGSNRIVTLSDDVNYPISKFKNKHFIMYNTADASESLTIRFWKGDNGTGHWETVLVLNQDEGCEIWCWVDPIDPANDSYWRGYKGGKT